METRVALIGIIIEEWEATEQLNAILHDASDYIIGRMGIPHVKEQYNIISIVMEAPAECINAVSGKLGMLKGVNSKVIYAKNNDEKYEKKKSFSER